ncbi:D-alanyl-D-alanine carboxypeptidase [Bifidobacterium hapali]|uniref:D-alanyl-D-alanine carboxypeptidase n=2 Tax=Bifidobacterium hapali TaxID=1630172 RepID=A0A261FVR4_9BIFI|nr:D-alanyl-D-alanine carboxypeptidase [Bifidobacterium hapali]
MPAEAVVTDNHQWTCTIARMRRQRIIRVTITALITFALCCTYVIADITDTITGPLTLAPVNRRSIPAALQSLPAGTIAGTANPDKPINSSDADQLVATFASATGVGHDYSIAIATADGKVVTHRNAGTPREPASTMKTLTALAAASTLDMGSTLTTETYLTDADTTAGTGSLTLVGHGDMLLSAGASDPEHVNGRAGLDTLAQDTAQVLNAQGINQVALTVDDTLFGQDRYPSHIADNNEGDLYYTGVSALAIDGGRQWDGGVPENPDIFSAYPTLSQTTASDAGAVFAARLADHGITVSNANDITVESVSTATSGSASDAADAPTDSATKPIASVQSATLAEILAFALRHSDNTLAEEFGRLTALATGRDNSPQGATQAVRATLERLNIDTTGLTMSDCSGLSPGSKLSVRTLVAVQAHNLTASGAAAAGEGLSIPGLIGTAANRAVSEDTLGLLRVKTGSLGEVTAMTGNVSRLGGGTLAFAVIVNHPDDMAAARDAIDVFVDSLAKL